MNIALDYENTYTLDPKHWSEFITLMRGAGHKIYCVTLRPASQGRPIVEELGDKVDGIFFTLYSAKRRFMYKQGIQIDVWIDDMPFFIEEDYFKYVEPQRNTKTSILV